MVLGDLLRQVMGKDHEIEGTILEMRTEEFDGREVWFFRLDSRPDVEFCFEVSSLSRPRQVGDRVRVVYAETDTPSLLEVSLVTTPTKAYD